MSTIIKRILLWTALILFVLAFIWVSKALSDQTIRRYDKDSNLIGYEVRSGNRETRYDQNWNREGHAVYEDGRVDRFDDKSNRLGYDIQDPDEDETEDQHGED